MSRFDSRRTKTMLSLVILCAALGGTQPAQAFPWRSGSCALQLTFSFSSRVRSALSLTSPSYSIAVSPLVDLDPTTGTVEPCAVTLVGIPPFRTTSVTASGNSNPWTCERVVASGSWKQTWNPDLSQVIADHTIAGTWGDWTMTIKNSSLGFVGVMPLTVHPSEASKLVQCQTNGITSLTMAGVLTFQHL